MNSNDHLSEVKINNLYEKLKKNKIVGECFQESFGENFFGFACERKSSNKSVQEGYGFGANTSKQEARIAAISEAVEHYCILKEKEDKFIEGSYRDLKPTAINPILFQNFSPSQLENIKYKQFRFDEKSNFKWIKGYSIFDNSEILVPAQLVFVEYKARERGEPWIRLPISTGAACGLNKSFATYKAICEIIERDNYMISYLSQLAPNIIEINDSNGLKLLTSEIEKQNLELFCLNATLDFQTTTIIAIILDRSGNGPAINFGLGCDLDSANALRKAFFESYSMYLSKKDYFFSGRKISVAIDSDLDWENFRKKTYWNSFINIEKINFLLKGRKKSNTIPPTHYTGSNLVKLRVVLKDLAKQKIKAFAVDVTDPVVKDCGLYVIKVLIPELYPMYNNQRYPYKRSLRLYNLPVDLGLRKTKIKKKEIFWQHPI